MHLKLFLVGGYILSILTLSPLVAAPGQYYRSIRSGTWNDLSVWECSYDTTFNAGVQAAADIPNYNCKTIMIRSGDTITLTSSVSIDEVVVDSGAVLVYGNYVGSVITISDGPGIDLKIEGTFEDHGPANLIWLTSQSAWILGNHGTMVRSRSTSAALWRDHYENGMSNIPSTSNWILRKLIVDPPSISGVNTWYGNLKIENMTSVFWNANLVGSKITGINSAPVIKGNMEIGTTGIAGIKFYSQNSALNRLKVEGELIIGVGSEFHLEDAATTAGASGIELWGDLTVNGILSYDLNEVSDQNRMIRFAGQTDQYIAGIGNIGAYNLSNSKPSGDLILLRDIEIQNKLILEEGKLDLNGKILTILNSTATAVERNSGWVKSERSDFTSIFRWKVESSLGLHEFPFGKNSDYIPVYISVESGTIGYVSVATYATSSSNQPLPVSPLIANLLFHGVESSIPMVDRFWYIYKTEISGTAQYAFTYASDEKKGSEETLNAIEYNEALYQWMEPLCCQTQSFVQRKVTVPGVQRNAVWSLIAPDEALYFESKDNFLMKGVTADYKGVLFPVPCDRELFFLHELQSEDPIHYEIFNSLGKKILEGDLLEGVMGVHRIDLSNINEKGTLYLQVKDSFSIKNYKLLRE